ncbi:LysR family transcriptional regulator [Vibrio quintilis]|uniref:HTH-type transcriptional regulator CysL n=1 Tax=Vibrio quintilis TaxID=1117707 RepID=A0A1M7Z2Y7_9VIBR|nr:LysR family transcriptional regulator [Vibrio quintilis]SHO59165.1 HTH-type transcriptional regulator CysL [Vibrio quintilis]
MNIDKIDWNLLKSFVFVIREGSLSAAARALRSTQPTIGRHIETLEDELGIALFTRSREGLKPTEEALNLFPEAQAMAGSYQALIRKISGENQSHTGTVRLAVSEIVGIEILPPLLKKFHLQHPQIKVELSISNQSENLLKREADLAIRMSQPKQDALIAKYIGISPVGLYGHKDYLKQYGTPKHMNELKTHKTIGPDEDYAFLELLKSSQLNISRNDLFFRVDNQIAQLQLLRQGLGIGAMQIQLAKKEPDLSRVLERDIEIPMPVYLIMHEDLRTTQRVRVLFNFLVNEMSHFVEQ